MSFETKGEAVIAAHSLEELRLVYRALHKELARFPDLLDTHFLIELQNFLQRKAAADGVDMTVHSEWEAWLAA
jgi:hypothetical protein